MFKAMSWWWWWTHKRKDRRSTNASFFLSFYSFCSSSECQRNDFLIYGQQHVHSEQHRTHLKMRHASHFFFYKRRRSTSGHTLRAAASRLSKFLIIHFFVLCVVCMCVCLKLMSLSLLPIFCSFCHIIVHWACVCHLSRMNGQRRTRADHLPPCFPCYCRRRRRQCRERIKKRKTWKERKDEERMYLSKHT